MDDFKTVMISNYYADKTTKTENLIQIYHQNTKHSKKYLMQNMYKSRYLLNNKNFLNATKKPEKFFPLHKSYFLKERKKNMLSDCLNLRRSQISEADLNAGLDFQIISDLFWAGYGQNAKGTRVVPSGGGLYPLELYGIVFETTKELEKGLYHYSPSKNSLQLIGKGNKLFDLESYIMMSKNLGNPSIIFFITSIFKRMSFKYDSRSYRYVLLEAGAMAQNMSLMATKYQLVSTFVGGTDDIAVEKILGIDGVNESLVNCLSISKDRNWRSNG